MSFNHRYRRHGLLFQNRHKSIICQEDACLKKLVRSVNLYPLRAGIVAVGYAADRGGSVIFIV